MLISLVLCWAAASGGLSVCLSQQFVSVVFLIGRRRRRRRRRRRVHGALAQDPPRHYHIRTHTNIHHFFFPFPFSFYLSSAPLSNVAYDARISSDAACVVLYTRNNKKKKAQSLRRFLWKN